MRFISMYGRFQVQIQHQIHEAYATGQVRIIQPQVVADFRPNLLTPEERQLAVERFRFNGSYQEEDEVTTVPPDHRIGLFDSVQAQQALGWSDELREKVERTLLDREEYFGEIFVVPAKTYTPPWPRYDEYTGSPAALLRKLLDEGHDVAATLDYERANQNRPKMVEELERELAEPTVEREETVVG